jgi:hypothetical protein
VRAFLLRQADGPVIKEKQVDENNAGDTLQDSPGVEESIEDQIIALDAPEEEAPAPDGEESDEPEQEEKPPRYTVKIDGKDAEVSLDDLISGYQTGKSSTQKYEEAANLRKQAEAEFHHAQQAKTAYQQQLDQFIPGQYQRLQEMQSELDRLATEDPAGWVAAKHQFDGEVNKLQQAQVVQQQMAQEQEQSIAQSYQQKLTQESQLLTAKIPEWSDEAKAKEGKAALVNYLSQDLGYRPEELKPYVALANGIPHVVDPLADHRAVVLLHKAYQYDQLMKKLDARKSKTAPPPPVTTVKTRGSATKDPARMSDKEFADWRRSQIKRR